MNYYLIPIDVNIANGKYRKYIDILFIYSGFNLPVAVRFYSPPFLLVLGLIVNASLSLVLSYFFSYFYITEYYTATLVEIRFWLGFLIVILFCDKCLAYIFLFFFSGAML